MSTNASDYLENKMLDHLFGVAAFTSPSLYLALFTATPNDAGGGTEVSGNNYSRTNISSAFGTAASRTISNDTTITTATASGSWGSMTHFGIYDASTSGNLLVYGALGATETVGDGDAISFAVGELDISFAAGGNWTDVLVHEMLDHVFAGAAYTAPTKYVGLFSAATNNSGGGTELTGNDYARTSAESAFGTGASSGTITSDANITFDTASGLWTEATHYAIMDALTSGNMLIQGALASGITVASADAARIASGSLSATLT